jgi:hypothetical protein|tara:strand:+ start:32574 stop:33467 length:894 start_codon:yes stop_codon:yes gene_type:complete
MKRIEAISHVITKLNLLKEGLNGGNSIPPTEFMKLSEVFKFGILPVKDRFTATILDEASKTTDDEEHLDMIDSMVGGIVAGEIDEEDDEEKEAIGNKPEEEELDELVDYDGSVMSSKIPMGTETNQTIGTTKTTDDITRATSQYGVWSNGGNFFKRYYGESVEEVSEIDKTGVLGVDETDQLDFDGAVEYYEDELSIPKDEAVERVEKERGPENLEKNKSDGSFTRHRLTEKERLVKIAEDKAKDMLEVLLSDKDDPKELSSSDNLLKSKINSLIKLSKANGVSLEDLRDMFPNSYE